MVAASLPVVALAESNDRKPAAAELEAEQLFVHKVWPLFSEKCLACHGGDAKEIQGKFDLRTRAGLLRGGDSGEAAVSPGRPEESPLLAAVSRSDPAFVMPPKENDKLSAEQVAWIRRWIAAGAPWPSDERIAELKRQPSAWNEADGVTVATSGGLSPEWTNRKYKPENLWPYQPLKKPAVPPGTTGFPATNAIDVLINARLAESGLRPAPRAERRTRHRTTWRSPVW
jgi:mono/diheme cytochrome c family protein